MIVGNLIDFYYYFFLLLFFNYSSRNEEEAIKGYNKGLGIDKYHLHGYIKKYNLLGIG